MEKIDGQYINSTDDIHYYYMNLRQIRKLIKAQRGVKFLICVSTFERNPEKEGYGWENVGHISVSRERLIKKVFHPKEGRYEFFSNVVRGRAVVKVGITKNLLFIGG